MKKNSVKRTVKRRSRGVLLKGWFLALAGLFVLFLLAGKLMRPDLSVMPSAYAPEAIQEAEELRDLGLDP